MTKVIELYAGPGAGKSTSAALLFGMLKLMGENAELVREYVKEWAWEGKEPKDLDQFYLFGKQLKKESMLYGKVDWIVTDSPIGLGTYYAEKYAPPSVADGVKAAVKGFEAATKTKGVERIRVILTRTKKYDPRGRFQSEEQARAIDDDMRTLICSILGGGYWRSGTTPRDLLNLLQGFGVSYNKVSDLRDLFRNIDVE